MKDASKPELMSPEAYAELRKADFRRELSEETDQASRMAAEKKKPLPSIGGKNMIRSARNACHKAAVIQRDRLRKQGEQGYAEDSHRYVLRQSISANEPVNAAAVEAYGIKLPDGYVKEGELYARRFAPESDS